MFDNCLPGIAREWANTTDIEASWKTWLDRSEHVLEEKLVLELAGDTSDSVVLDIGCGMGRYAHCLKYKDYYGLDVWSDSVAYAKRLTDGLENCRFLIGSVFHEWPVKPDLVLTLNVFRHFQDPMSGYNHVWNKLPVGAGWITDFLTAYEGDEIVLDGEISTLIPKWLMTDFLLTKQSTVPKMWMEEVGQWWLVRIDKT